MTDRDEFAAAALTGVILFHRDDESHATPGDLARWAYCLADAMLRQRGNDASAQPSDGQRCTPATLSTPGEGSEPIAWAVMSVTGGVPIALFEWESPAVAVCQDFCKRDGDAWIVVPLYRHPQPTITDAEREAIAHAADLLIGSRPGATLRGLLERLG